jgi:hypothetical protein
MLLAAGAANANVRHVPSDYPTIQAAIDASTFGDKVLVAPGTYVEEIKLMGPAADGIHLASTGGPEVTTIMSVTDPDWPQRGRTTVFCQEVGASTIIEGFTITGGFNTGTAHGGGINTYLSDVVVRNNIITKNTAGSGGGIALHGGSPTIIGNTIFRNTAGCWGGGIACFGVPEARIIRNLIYDNGAVGLFPCPVGYGGGIAAEGSELISECTIVGNHAASGSGIYVLGSPTVIRTIIAFNAANGIEVDAYQGGSPSISCSDVFANTGSNYAGMPDPTGTNGNQSADPLFCDLSAKDFTISTFSPCAPAHSPSGCDLVGALPPVCAIVPAVQSSWGQLKARYR